MSDHGNPSKGQGKSEPYPDHEEKRSAFVEYITSHKPAGVFIAFFLFSLGAPMSYFGSNPNILYLVPIALCALILYFSHDYITSLKSKSKSGDDSHTQLDKPPPTPLESQHQLNQKLDEAVFIVEDNIEYSIDFGGNITGGLRPANFQKNAQTNLSANGSPLIDARVEQNRLYIDTLIYAGDNTPPIQVARNRVTGLPRGWDANFDTCALEIVDAKPKPVFQLEYKTSHDIQVRGIFPMPGGFACVGSHGVLTVSDTDTPEVDLPLLFRYPSKQHKQERWTE